MMYVYDEDEEDFIESMEESIRAALADQQNEEDMHDPAYD